MKFFNAIRCNARLKTEEENSLIKRLNIITGAKAMAEQRGEQIV